MIKADHDKLCASVLLECVEQRFLEGGEGDGGLVIQQK